MERQLIQGQNYYLAGSGIGLTDTSINVLNLVFSNPTQPVPVPITMSMFGTDSIGYATLEPETPREENISFTGITFQGNNTWTLSGVVRGLPLRFDYYTPDTATIQPHAGGSLIRFTDNMANMGMFTNRWNSETIYRPWTFTHDQNPHYNSQPASFANLDLIDKQFGDGNYLKVDGSNQMNASLNVGNHTVINMNDPVNPKDGVNLETLQAAAIAGATPATELQGGIVKVATDTEFVNTTDTTTIGPFTFYNMAKLSQLKKGVNNFTYGENIAANNYVFQADAATINFTDKDMQANTGAVSLTTTSDFTAQVITTLPTSTGIKYVTYTLGQSGGITGTLKIDIYAMSGGLPVGPALASSQTVNMSTVANTTGPQPVTNNITFTFATAFASSPSTQYALVINTASVTYGGGTIYVGYPSVPTGNGATTSTDGGVTWSPVGGGLDYAVGETLTAGDVYNVNEEPGAYSSMGPYMGVALATGIAGEIHAVQLTGIATGFVGLNAGGQIYIDNTTPGGITQNPSNAGRSVGTAVTTTSWQLTTMKKVAKGVSLAQNTPAPADGYLIASWTTGTSPDAGSWTISTDNFLSDPGVTYNIGVTAASEAVENFVTTVPVKQGAGYTASSGSGSTAVTFIRIVTG